MVSAKDELSLRLSASRDIGHQPWLSSTYRDAHPHQPLEILAPICTCDREAKCLLLLPSSEIDTVTFSTEGPGEILPAYHGFAARSIHPGYVMVYQLGREGHPAP
jgi:hypothetical protein